MERKSSFNARYLNFSNEEDENLIDLVQQYRPLYDVNEKDYKDLSARNNLWIDVSKKMGRSVSECKKRWRSIKDTYYRHKRNKNKSTWILLKRLQFLDSSGRSEGSADATFHQENHNFPKEEEMIFADNGIPEKDDTVPTTKITGYQFIDEVFPYDPDSASSYMNYTDDEVKRIQQKNREKLGEYIETDPICMFFHSMALSVKRLPPDMIAEARVKICQLVGRLEVEAYKREEQQNSNNYVKVEEVEEQIG